MNQSFDSHWDRVIPRYFFVTGARKSGTTWLTKLLNSHPEAFCTGEGFFIGEYGLTRSVDPEIFKSWFNENTVQWSWMENTPFKQAQHTVHRGMIEAAIRSHLKAKDVPDSVVVVGDKTPGVYGRHPGALHDIFPEAHIINIVRDGRDVAVSDLFMLLRLENFKSFPEDVQVFMKKARAAHVDRDGSDCPLFCEHLLKFEAHVWKNAYEGSLRLKELYGDRYIEVQYEQLLQTPTIIADIYKHLGIDANEEMVTKNIETNSFKKKSGRQRGSESSTSFYRKGVAGDWVNHFSQRDHEIYLEIAGEALQASGYDIDTPSELLAQHGA